MVCCWLVFAVCCNHHTVPKRASILWSEREEHLAEALALLNPSLLGKNVPTIIQSSKSHLHERIKMLGQPVGCNSRGPWRGSNNKSTAFQTIGTLHKMCTRSQLQHLQAVETLTAAPMQPSPLTHGIPNSQWLSIPLHIIFAGILLVLKSIICHGWFNSFFTSQWEEDDLVFVMRGCQHHWASCSLSSGTIGSFTINEGKIKKEEDLNTQEQCRLGPKPKPNANEEETIVKNTLLHVETNRFRVNQTFLECWCYFVEISALLVFSYSSFGL